MPTREARYRCAVGLQTAVDTQGAVLIEPANDEKGSRRANPVDVHVGSRVRFRRMLLGMSQERLGERLGLTFQQVQKYEKGVNRIGASRLFELARVLGVSVNFFYDDAPDHMAPPAVPASVPGFAEMPAETYAADFLSSREGLELNKAFARITDAKVRKTIVDLVRSLAGEETIE
jgi:transcriptional regulator with XRE-family HTH domain